MAKKTTNDVSNLPAKRQDSPFAVVKCDPEDLRDIVQINLGGEQLSAFDLERIRVPDGKSDFWTIPTQDGTEAAKEVDGIIIHFRDVRSWWPDDEPTGKPPVCSSEDTRQGIGSRECGDQYVGDPGDKVHSCATCAYAQFGSDPKGGKGQWCKQMKMVFLLTPDKFLPMCIILPPTSLKNAKDYMIRLMGSGSAFNHVVSRLTLLKDKNETGQEYNKVEFARVRSLSNAEKEVIRGYTAAVRPAFATVKVESDEDYYNPSPDTPHPNPDADDPVDVVSSPVDEQPADEDVAY